ncbi:MAG TPA: ribosome biogenesis factor YjgA [Gammaproteobacteria bacterium]|nr:ribosome biogenesis factor YjgA [Gammaproteobacteria bacterium]
MRRDDEAPSKSQRKREAAALQSLGELLAELPAEQLDLLDLPDRLRQALEQLRGIASHEARRRQRQFIGKLMRDLDPAPLQAFIDAQQRPSRESARLFRVTETWRDRLVAEGDAAVRAFLATYPLTDAAALAEAVTAARQQRSGAPKRLFRMLRDIVERQAVAHGSPGGATLLE